MSFHKTFPVGLLQALAFDGIDIFNYGDYAEKSGWWGNGQAARNNYGTHTMAFRVINITFYFSYDTLIAFYHRDSGFCARENEWGVNTGSHLNTIYWKFAKRLSKEECHWDLPNSEFQTRLYNLASKHGLAASNGLGQKLPKELMAIETGEVVDAKYADNPDAINTSLRKLDREFAVEKAKKLKATRSAAAKKGAVTRRRNLERAACAAAFAEREAAIEVMEGERRKAMTKIMTEDCFLQEGDVPVGGLLV